MIRAIAAMLATTMLVSSGGDGCDENSADEKQEEEQARSLAEGHAQIGMPAIGDFSEKREVKDLYELRDKPIPTHSYIANEMKGCLMYLGTSIGYGLPYATQYTSPTRLAYRNGGYRQVPQAEPNGLFMPSSAEGTWIMLKPPGEDKVQPVYVEPRVVVSPFRLVNLECPPVKAEEPTPPAKR